MFAIYDEMRITDSKTHTGFAVGARDESNRLLVIYTRSELCDLFASSKHM